MEDQRKPKRYEYEISYRNSRGMLVAFSVLLFAFGIFYLYVAVHVFFNPDNFDSSALFNAILSFILFSIGSPLFLFFIAYLYPDVNEDERGLHFKFLFKTYDVLWDEVLYTKAAKPLGFKMRHGATLVVTKSRLTFFHRLYGLIYGKTNNPSLVILSKISDYPSLTKSIVEKIKTNPRTSK